MKTREQSPSQLDSRVWIDVLLSAGSRRRYPSTSVSFNVCDATLNLSLVGEQTLQDINYVLERLLNFVAGYAVPQGERKV